MASRGTTNGVGDDQYHSAEADDKICVDPTIAVAIHVVPTVDMDAGKCAALATCAIFLSWFLLDNLREAMRYGY
jgi:hypothetical protein